MHGTNHDEMAHMDVRSIRLEDIQEYVNRLEDMSASTSKSRSRMPRRHAV